MKLEFLPRGSTRTKRSPSGRERTQGHSRGFPRARCLRGDKQFATIGAIFTVILLRRLAECTLHFFFFFETTAPSLFFSVNINYTYIHKDYSHIDGRLDLRHSPNELPAETHHFPTTATKENTDDSRVRWWMFKTLQNFPINNTYIH